MSEPKPMPSYWALAEEVTHLHGLLDKYQDENAELRKERDFYFQQVTENGERMQRVIDALNAENAKLRELVGDIWEACPTDGYYCIYHCEHYDKESESHCKLEARMAELGVEVDG